jgi:membrane-bound lytic murein transglycosylase B
LALSLSQATGIFLRKSSWQRLAAVMLLCVIAMTTRAGDYDTRADVKVFVDEMVSKYQFDRTALTALLAQAQKKQAILDAISRPAEKMKTWHEYRDIFITESRITHGVLFYRKNQQLIDAIAKQYGVPQEILLGILGVETRFGTQAGNYRVLDALATLAFDYPPRAPFFRGQLEQFLLMTRDNKLDAPALVGSYAGAMGWGQFIPSSYRDFAVDGDGDKVADIWNNPADAIASIANYFKQHGWKTGELVTIVARPMQQRDESVANGELKPAFTVATLKAKGFEPAAPVAPDMPASLWRFEGEDGIEYWIGLHNFFVITEYNHSPMYAMAVYQLGQEIRRHVE